MESTATATPPNPAGRRSVYLTRPAEMTTVLKVLRDHAAEVELRLAGADTLYTGRVLDVTAGEFLLEDIRPRDGLLRMRRRTRFSFAAMVNGLYLRAEDCAVTAVESERGLPYFRASLPKRLLRQQRRRHTRITLPPRISPDDGVIRLRRGGGADEALRGHLIDVSAGGCRAVFDGPVTPVFTADEDLPHCELTVTDTLAFTARGIVRHSTWDDKQRVTTCGIEFTEMAISDRRRLEHYVHQLSGRAASRG